jgi:hypothetical protein
MYVRGAPVFDWHNYIEWKQIPCPYHDTYLTHTAQIMHMIDPLGDYNVYCMDTSKSNSGYKVR